jgi:putative ABC transport system permease protein
VIAFFSKLTLGHFRKHGLEALLCLIGVALGVAVVVAIDSAVAACVRSFEGAVSTLAERSTHSIFAENEPTIPDEIYIALANKHLPSPMAPMIDRRVLAGARDDAAPVLVRLIGVDVFSERSLRSFTNMKSTLDDEAFRRFLTAPGAVVLAEPLATRLGVSAGSDVRLTIGPRRIPVHVVGIASLSGVARSQLADLLICDLATAQELTDSIGKIDRIDLNIAAPEQEKAITAALPSGYALRSTREQSTSLSELIASYKLNLNSLSLMASFVAVFIVYNSMLISVQQRAMSLGILRCLGGSRGQLVRIYLSEAFGFAIVGGVLGMLAGWALSRLLVGYISTTINDLYAAVRPGPVTLGAAAFAKGLAVSTASCLLGAALPLYRASRTPPINVMRATERADESARASSTLLIAGLVLLFASWALYLLPGNSPIAGFLMALTISLGFAFICPAITRVVAGLVAAIARPIQALPLQMAASGVGRSLSITGVAVAAMMLATSMNVGVRTMVTSFRGALSSWLDRRFAADVFIGSELLVDHRIDATLDPAIEPWTLRQPEVAKLIPIRSTTADIAGKPSQIVATDVAHLLAHDFPIKSKLSQPFDPARDVLVSEPLAGRLKLRPGDALSLDTPAGALAFRVHAVFYDFGNERGQVMLDHATYAAKWHDDRVSSIHVVLRPGHRAEDVAARCGAELRPTYPVVVNSYQGVKRDVLAVFDRTFKVTSVLSWLAGGVAFCGLAGALLALALARQRDYSVLAAVGMSARQTAAWVIGQGMLIAWISAAVAAVAGTILAYVLSYVIQYRSFGWSIPTSPQPRFWLQSFILATIAALAAAWYPIHRLRTTPPAASLRQE